MRIFLVCLIFLSLIYGCAERALPLGVKSIFSGSIMDGDDVPSNIVIAYVSDKPAPSAISRNGTVITASLYNKSYRTYDKPLFMACHLAPYNRTVVMKAESMIGSSFEAQNQMITPNSLSVFSFSTKLDWDYEPIGDNETVTDCVIGVSKFQALMQMGVDPSDQNRSRR